MTELVSYDDMDDLISLIYATPELSSRDRQMLLRTVRYMSTGITDSTLAE